MLSKSIHRGSLILILVLFFYKMQKAVLLIYLK